MTPCPPEQTSPWESQGIPTKCRSVSEKPSVRCHLPGLHSILHISCLWSFTSTWTPLFLLTQLEREFLLSFFLRCSLCHNSIAVSFIASPWTCGEAHPRQGPRRLQGWQGRLWIQNGGKQSGCKGFLFFFSFLNAQQLTWGYLFIYCSCFWVSCHSGGRAQICRWHHHRQERRDDQEDSERRGCQDPVQTRSGERRLLIKSACCKVIEFWWVFNHVSVYRELPLSSTH